MKKSVLEFIVFLPSSKTLSYGWNLGSLLGMFLGLQLLTGVILVFYYGPDTSFDGVQYIMYDVSWGWLVRILHFNGASFFFFFLYMHVFKGFFMKSYRLVSVGETGILSWFLFMGVGFMGYVLVYSQMNFWAAVFLTSMLAVVPYLEKLWVFFFGGIYGVGDLTVNFFFVWLFLWPGVGAVWVLFLLIFLQIKGKPSLLYCQGNKKKVIFFPYYGWKKKSGVWGIFFFLGFVFVSPFFWGNGKMFKNHKKWAKPGQIAPKGNFLFVYTIRRPIPKKFLGGYGKKSANGCPVGPGFFKVKGKSEVVKNSELFFVLVGGGLTWWGMNAPEVPYLLLSGGYPFFFFFFFFLGLYFWLGGLLKDC
uniref:Cytochrome b n=1 Tax=Oxyuris equi TaxID=132389 RepID=A0A0G2T9W1_9BILA|nr:cytochrome b [Oxyuris equi]AKI07540.1 cytochrome b [Oxyuris equi]